MSKEEVKVYGSEKSKLLKTNVPYMVSKTLADTLVKKGAASLKPIKEKVVKESVKKEKK